MDEALTLTGIGVANIEMLRGWASPGHDEGFERREAMAFEMADRWQCRYVQVIGDADGSLDGAAAGFAALCDRAADHGLLVGLEWVPGMTNIVDARTALRIVEDADRPNGTVVPQGTDYYEDCLANRVPPGDGEFALVDMIRILDAAGSTAPIGIEVCSAELWPGSVERAAQTGADGMRRVLADARG